MSILIKGIDLPKDREFILLKVFPDGKTRIGLSTNYTQAIQIDRPHGRIIDESNWTTHEVLEPMGNGQYEEVEVAYKGDIDNAPTILEAEEEE